ncbi:PSD1 and planctomycete cytochrome C domain-containing protein [Planctomyces sp. SH-PL62]|uniref:PSD1 and planctomycete cytochrome C domain-containing protein n=1 Tax=Planctomyces sp. SH-PL62 TaxID=1636152 RepID=UPI00078DE880|nr:PSD1 and planctomycete cytochrome C domain-containing protein [Planctomyces sp. SH-PL62]AMV38881.1 Planctomycete cytochrome C [Planctomyces sp. SH-PL62]
MMRELVVECITRRRRPTQVGRVALAMLTVLLVAGNAGADEPAGASAPKKTVRFNRDVRPILSEKCFQCHGPDATQRKGKLRLDTAHDATAPAASGDPAIIPGDVENSGLIYRATTDDADDKMPPAKLGKPLTPEEIQVLQTWIAEGAEYEGHWAFLPPERAEPPQVSRPDWVRNPIDAWILHRLDQEGLSPSPEADRATLVRRLSLDLIGLPPTIAEVDSFLGDDRPGAYERLVDRLLDSPHYGERWGRVWLDAARYADSDGYEKDKPRTVHFYRDWVVQALNRDLPYDRFVVEQLAGDLLPSPTQDQLVATGFLRNSMINEEGGIDPEQFRVEAMFDRMDAVGKAVLGLTIQCAQCHTHKFDPITHEDYFRMFAFLNSVDEATVAAYTPEELHKRGETLEAIAAVEEGLRRDHPDWADRMRSWEDSVRDPGPTWNVVRTDVDANNGSGQKHTLLEDGSLLASGYAPTLHTAQFTALQPVPTVSAIRLELLNDPSLPLSGPGRSTKGLLALTEFHVEAAPADRPDERKEIAIVRATADVNPSEAALEPIFDDKSGRKRVTGPIAFAVDRKDETAWGIDAGAGRRNVPRKAVFTFDKPVSFPSGVILTFKLTQRHGGWNSDDNQNNNFGRFRFSTTDAADAQADPLPDAVRKALAIAPEARSAEQTNAVFSHFRTTVPDWKEADERIEALWKQHPEGSSQLVLRDRPRETRLFQRGDFLKPADPVQPGFPAFLNPPPTTEGPPSRLTFAEWLVNREAPTPARSIVNRVWQSYFGTGLTATSEDLGSQCETPSHPELLDWLAVEFMDRGWSLKTLHRLIVESNTYRQTSRVSPDLLAKDPFNRLLARGARVRADAEVVRDVALAAGGLLDPTIGGPSVNPPAPAFLFQPPASYGPKAWPESVGSEKYRRALYTFRYRSIPYPMLQAFDAPNGDFACVRRARSNTPLQALALLNEPVSLDCARSLATLVLKEGGSTETDRLVYAFRRCLARKPTDQEIEVLSTLLHKQAERFATGAVDPAKLSGVTDGPAAEHASWTVVARVLLNLDETITKE